MCSKEGQLEKSCSLHRHKLWMRIRELQSPSTNTLPPISAAGYSLDQVNALGQNLNVFLARLITRHSSDNTETLLNVNLFEARKLVARVTTALLQTMAYLLHLRRVGILPQGRTE